MTNECKCNDDHFGKTCEHNKYEHIAFDLDCSNMGEEYVSSCLRQTHGGSCPKYRLVWDRLCYRTCAALPGILCTPFVRQSYCANSPECPGLCNDMLDMYCLNAARGFDTKAVAKDADKLASAPSPASEQSTNPVQDKNPAKGVSNSKVNPPFKCVNGTKVLLSPQTSKSAFSKIFKKSGDQPRAEQSDNANDECTGEDIDSKNQEDQRPGVKKGEKAQSNEQNEQKDNQEKNDSQKSISKKNKKADYKAGQTSASDNAVKKNIEVNQHRATGSTGSASAIRTQVAQPV